MNTSITPIQEQDNLSALTLATGQPLQHLAMAEFIALALAACASDSEHTRRAYTRAWGDFLAYLSSVWGLGRSLAIEEKVLRDDGKMTRTQWAYSGDTRIFGKIAPSLRDGFLQAMVDAGLARKTRNQRLNAVNTLLSLAFRDGYIAPDQSQRLGIAPYKKRQRSDETPVGRRLSRDEVKALRWAVDGSKSSDVKRARDIAIVDCMLYAALRRSEVAGLQTGDVSQDGGRWWLKPSTTKGGKPRRVKIHDALYKTLLAWASLAGVKLGEGETILFRNVQKGGELNGPLNASVIGRLVSEYGSLAGLAPKNGPNCISPHDLRRTCARNAYDNGATVLQVQAMLGHSDPKTTIRYIGALENDDETAVDHVKY
jgi:integrase